MPTPAALAAAHLLAGFLVLVAPLLAYRNAHRPHAAAPGARLRRYRWLVLRQLILISALVAWIATSGVPRARVGLGPPFSWWWSGGASIVVAAFMLWSAIALRRRAAELRDKMRDRAGALLLPETNLEARWFGLVSLCGG